MREGILLIFDQIMQPIMFTIDHSASTLKENHIFSTVNLCANVLCMKNHFYINLQDYWATKKPLKNLIFDQEKYKTALFFQMD